MKLEIKLSDAERRALLLLGYTEGQFPDFVSNALNHKLTRMQSSRAGTVSSVPAPPPETAADQTELGTSARVPRLRSSSSGVLNVLREFSGESTCKRIFWEELSYEAARDPLELPDLLDHIRPCLHYLEVFASSASMRVAYASLRAPLSGTQIEQLAGACFRELGDCVLLLHDRPDPANAEGWSLILPDPERRPRIRMLALPGPSSQIEQTAAKLSALAAESEAGEELSDQELYEELNRSFPGHVSRLDQVVSDYAEIANHPDGEIRDLLPFYRDFGHYPLLTAAQERGEDLRGDEVPPDGSVMPYQKWRLMVHNARLVLWQARKIPRYGITLSDLVQEGFLGLMTAVERWEPQRGYRFATYATWWVRQRMFRAVHDQGNVIRWPVHRSVQLVPALLRGQDIAVRASERPVRSFDQNATNLTLFAVSDPELTFAERELQRRIRLIVKQIEKRQQRRVLRARYGLGDKSKLTLDTIGRHLNLTRERVRQIEAKALEHLRGELSFDLLPLLHAANALTNGRRSVPCDRRHRPYMAYMLEQDFSYYAERSWLEENLSPIDTRARPTTEVRPAVTVETQENLISALLPTLRPVFRSWLLAEQGTQLILGEFETEERIHAQP